MELIKTLLLNKKTLSEVTLITITSIFIFLISFIAGAICILNTAI